MKNEKKVLVTGATGFIGANLINKLINDNFEVHALIRKSSNTWRLKGSRQRIKLHVVDLLEKNNLRKILNEVNPTGIFHLANSGLYGGVDSEPKEYINTNFLGTINLITLTKDLNYEWFVNVGSSSEYGEKDRIMRESDICQPKSVYGITKLASSLYARAFAKKNNKPIVTLRLFSPYGPFDHHLRLIPSIITRLLKKEHIIINSPDTVRDYIYTEDVLDAFMACLTKAKKCEGEVFNIGSGKQTRTEDVVKIIIKQLAVAKADVSYQKKSNRIESSVWKADITKAKTLLGWSPKYTLQKGLAETVIWFKNNLEFY